MPSIQQSHNPHGLCRTARGVIATAVLALLACMPLQALAFSDLPGNLPSLPGLPGLPGGGGAVAGWEQETIAGMNVYIYTPASEPALGDGRALMLTLHGCSQSANDMASVGNWKDTADEYGMMVVAPDVPNGGVIIGCWDYYGTNHTRTNRHNGNLLNLVNEIVGRSELNIDPDQVYVTGLSSGGGEAMVLGCMAPDVFAGFGNNAGPTIGTGSNEVGSVATTQAAAVQDCRGLSGNNASHLDTQVSSMIYGSGDFSVAQAYNELNADVMAEIYGADNESRINMSNLPGTNTGGSGRILSDAEGPRVSVIKNTGLGHAWPAGNGTGGNYISGNSVDYPASVTKFFFENNRRVDGVVDDDDDNDDDDSNDNFQCQSHTASNTEHVDAGRAEVCNTWFACAVGSGDSLGYNGAYINTTVSETSEGYFEKGSCQ